MLRVPEIERSIFVPAGKFSAIPWQVIEITWINRTRTVLVATACLGTAVCGAKTVHAADSLNIRSAGQAGVTY